MKTKLAMVISTFAIGGGQKVVLDLLKAIDKTRFDVKLFVHSAPVENQFTIELSKNGIPMEFIHRDERVSWRSYRGLSKALCEFNPDVVHIHLDTLYAPIWALFHNKKVVFTVHSQAHRAFSSRFYIKLHRYLSLHRNYLITAVSDTIAKETEKVLGIKKKVCAIYNPVEIKTPVKRDICDEINFVNVARFHKVKNHKLLIDAFYNATREFPKMKLRLAGDGPLEEELKSYADRIGATEHIEFLGNVENVGALLEKSDVFILSSDSEALPISILEAMAHGLPIVSTAVGGVPDIVTDNGLLVEKGNMSALSEAILKMANSDDFRAECRKKSFEYVQKFSVDNIIKKYEKLYLSR